MMKSLFAVSAVLVMTSSSSFGQFLELGNEDFALWGGGVDDWAIGICVEEPLPISSIGVSEGVGPVEIRIFESDDGFSFGPLVQSESNINNPQNLAQWWDIPFDFAFQADQCYVVELNNLASAGLEFYRGSALPMDVGPLTVVSGARSSHGDPLNLGTEFNLDNATVRMRFNVVPEPNLSYSWLLALPLLGVRASRFLRISSSVTDSTTK